MQYTRAQLLEAFRTDHPELRNVPDNQLFAAIAQDHPDIVRGISELNPAQPAQTPTATTPAQAPPKSLWDIIKADVGREVTAPIPALKAAYQSVANPRAAFQAGGTMVGGTIGSAAIPLLGPAGPILGAAAGGSIGESLYQLGGHTGVAPSVFGQPPQSSSEAAGRHAELLGLEAAGAGLVKYGPNVVEAVVAPKETFKQTVRSLQATPETLITRATQPSDLNFQRHIGPALSEIKAFEKKFGQPTTTAQQGINALDFRTGVNNQIVDEIVDPQQHMRAHGSRAPVRDAEIAAIPEDIRLHDPERYQQLVQQANARVEDYTIGELNTLRKELNATQSPYYGKDVEGRLTMDAGVRAMDIARGKEIRNQFYTGLDKYGLGGSGAAREINSRIGSMIHMKDALQPRVNRSIAQLESVGERTQDIARGPLSLYQRFRTTGKPWTVDKNLRKAMQRWDVEAPPVDVRMEPPIKNITGTQPPLITAPQGLFSQEFQGGRIPTSMSPEGYANQLRQQDIYRQGAAKPPSGQMGLETMAPPGVFSTEFQGGRIPSPLTPAGYVEQLQQQRAWNAGAPILPPGQLDIQKGIPPKVFGIEQQFPTGPQQSFSFGNQGITPTPGPQAGQQQFAFPKTERELWIEEFFKKNPHLDIRGK